MAISTRTVAARLSALGVAALIAIALTGSGPLKPAAANAAGPAFAVGMYNTGTPWSFTSVSSLEAQMNFHMQIIHWYQAWGATPVNARDFDPSFLTATVAHGSTPFISWEPWDITLATNQQTFPLRAIASGQFDSYIDTWANGLHNYGQPVLLSFAHEMQGDWYPWGYGVNGNTAADYISAYRHVHDRFTAAGATNVRWVWTVDADDAGSSRPPATTFYPGDAYTDWLGVDAYNWGTSQSWSSWRSLADVLSNTYQEFTQLNATKPILLSEWGSTEAGGSKPAWILAAANDLQQYFPRVQAVIWFHEHGSRWAIDSSPQSVAAAGQAFRQLANPGCIGGGSVATQTNTSGSGGLIVRMGTLTCLLIVPPTLGAAVVAAPAASTPAASSPTAALAVPAAIPPAAAAAAVPAAIPPAAAAVVPAASMPEPAPFLVPAMGPALFDGAPFTGASATVARQPRPRAESWLARALRSGLGALRAAFGRPALLSAPRPAVAGPDGDRLTIL